MSARKKVTNVVAASEVPRWKTGETIHCGSIDGNDVSLCGDAFEGEDGSDEMTQVLRGKINCDRCLRIIRRCKEIPARLLAKAQGA